MYRHNIMLNVEDEGSHQNSIKQYNLPMNRTVRKRQSTRSSNIEYQYIIWVEKPYLSSSSSSSKLLMNTNFEHAKPI